MTSKELIALMGCGRKYRLRALSLKGRNEKNLCFHAALGMLAKGMAKGAERPALLQEIKRYLESAYREEWFYLDWQKERAVARDMEYLERFLTAYGDNIRLYLSCRIPLETAESWQRTTLSKPYWPANAMMWRWIGCRGRHRFCIRKKAER